MEQIKIGQIGIGHNHGEAKMQAVRKRPDLFEVIGYAEPDDKWVEKRGSHATYADLPRLSVKEVIEKSDAVLIETDVWNLDAYAKMCLDAGKHIHMDKPAAGPLAAWKSMLDEAKEKGLVLQMGYMYRYNPAIRECLNKAKSGALGEIYSINAEMSTFHKPVYKNWLRNFQGGIMYILGSHLIDLIVYLLGEPERVVSFMKHTGLDGIDLEDNDLAVLEYDKALARVNVTSVEVNGWGRRQFVVCGSKGTVNICPIENKITMTYSDLNIATNCYEDMHVDANICDIPKDCRYDDMMQDFYDYIKGTKENPFTYEHEYIAQKVLYEVCGGDSALKPGVAGVPGYDI